MVRQSVLLDLRWTFTRSLLEHLCDYPMLWMYGRMLAVHKHKWIYGVDTEQIWGGRTLDLILCRRPRLSSQGLRLL